jgi:hypothetical protein
VYAAEYEASLAACMGSSEQLCAEMVAQHRAHVAACDANGPLAKLVHAARELKRELAHVAAEVAAGPTAPIVAAAVPPRPPPSDAQLQPATRAGTAGAEAPSVESDAEAHRTARAGSSALTVRLSACACSDSLVRASVLVL